MLTSERLREVLHYDPESGIFTWIKSSRPGWVGKVAGSIASGGYLQILVDKHPYRSHILAWLYMTGKWPELEVDHKNRIRTDNSWDNLRQATDSEQCRNRNSTPGKSGVRGVSPYRGRWKVQTTLRSGVRTQDYFADLFSAVAHRKSQELKEGYCDVEH